MSDLPIEKQLTHHQFCEQIADIRDRNVLIEMLKQLHVKYLADQAAFVRMAKGEFIGVTNDNANKD
jgi:hypothetical protein